MSVSKLLIHLGALFGAAIILASCTVVVEEGPTRPPRPDRPQICTREYAPVCARAGSRQRTFSNACMARAAGYRPVHPGQCRQQSERPDRPQACTMEYRPVCARRGGSVRTFGNACSARAEGYRVVRPGAC
ncbi:Kazal-type serine protease inhibitor [Nitratireductor sp. ZSWI3]|uniref:Kazal-type serine protease inhibitor family protein n=1 Tax=Nitratireductor sp. ZSWI3 TaxID=2966359 RepID=UPI00214F9C2F|nr:Kazal-type serine protease inhibitor [Nitratireductor sp. ZSWI3]MCR4268676.1 Kazal-type serine protease inhibitor [Nitratireductor sp. ZSWI3]